MEQLELQHGVFSEGTIACCDCGTPIAPNPANMCLGCVRARADITDGIPKQYGVCPQAEEMEFGDESAKNRFGSESGLTATHEVDQQQQSAADEPVKNRFGSESGSTAADGVDQQQQQQIAADESAKSRFGIVSNVEIVISCKKFDRLLRSIGLKMTQMQQCQEKRIGRPRKTKERAAGELSEKNPKRNANDTAGGGKRSKMHGQISEFDKVMNQLMLNPKKDPVFLKCTEIRGMTDPMAYHIFQINQFLCHFVSLIPAEELGTIKDKDSFAKFNMSIVQKTLDEREGPQMLKEKMMFTLATTIKYSQKHAQCQEGISYARRMFSRVDDYLPQVNCVLGALTDLSMEEATQKAKQLMKDLEEIDAEIRQHGTVLAENKIGMNEPLVDADGFPRNDVNVYAVRTARHAIICLQNDRKQKMDEIENALHAVHAQANKEQRSGDD